MRGSRGGGVGGPATPPPPQHNNQITRIQVRVPNFFLLKVGPPPWKKFSGSAPDNALMIDVSKVKV